MDINIFYSSHIISLFVDNFEKIKKTYTDDLFNFINFENIFNNIIGILSDEHINQNNFIKYYYLFTFLYLNYTNYLFYIGHNDISNINLEKIVKKTKTSNKIVNNIFKFINNKNIIKILKVTNIFILKKIKKNIKNNSNNKIINEHIINIKQLDKISELPNDNYKKILNLIIYRYIICKNNNYSNYHEFYTKKIIKNKNLLLSPNKLDELIIQISKSKKILDININKKINSTINICILKVINFILNKYEQFYIDSNTNDTILIKNKNSNDIIKIIISNKYDNVCWNNYQTNYSMMHYEIEQLKEFNFLKKTFSNIEICIGNKNLNDLSNLLEFIHLITISLKILSSYPSDIYECLYQLEYTNYYFDTFCYFFEFIKTDINQNYYYNKFIIDVVKFMYIYSYYDFYFYYNNNLLETLIDKIDFKNQIFSEFLENLKNTLKLPKELLQHPPFFKNDYDINTIIYYNFEIPSYYKFIDLINAITVTFGNCDLNNNKDNIVDIISKYIDYDNNNLFTNKLKKQKINKKKSYDSSNSSSLLETNNHTGKSITNLSNTDETDETDETSKNNNLEESEIITKNKTQSKLITKNYSDLESNLNSEIIKNLTKKNKKQMINPNTYIELNYNKTNFSDCILNTEI